MDGCRESDPNWVRDIEQDVTDECSKYGTVSHIHADPKSKVIPPTSLSIPSCIRMRRITGICLSQIRSSSVSRRRTEGAPWPLVCWSPNCGGIPILADLQQSFPMLNAFST